MTREEFIEVLDREGYSYEIEGDKIIVTNQGSVYLTALTSISHGVEFRNRGYVYLTALTSISPGVMFNNRWDIDLESLIGGYLNDWSGNIDGIDPKRLFNLMIKQGVFER